LPILIPIQIPNNPPIPFPRSDQSDKKEFPKITGIYPPIIEKIKIQIQIIVFVDTNLSYYKLSLVIINPRYFLTPCFFIGSSNRYVMKTETNNDNTITRSVNWTCQLISLCGSPRNVGIWFFFSWMAIS
jgi:hypothetical protein